MKLIHLRNNQVVNDVAKQPSADSLEYEEADQIKKEQEDAIEGAAQNEQPDQQ